METRRVGVGEAVEWSELLQRRLRHQMERLWEGRSGVRSRLPQRRTRERRDRVGRAQCWVEAAVSVCRGADAYLLGMGA